MGVYGIVLAGYAANSKYPFFGGIRSSAQMISYEISMGMSVIPVLLIVGNLNLSTIIRWQGDHGWLVFYAPLAFIIFLVASFAETNRTPFDLPEAETELVGGYHTEYSSMKFALFFLARIFQHGFVLGHDGDAVLRRLDAAVLGAGSAGADAANGASRTS